MTVFNAPRIGFLPLAKLSFLDFLGGDQFRKFCVVSIIMLVITVWITCFFHEEKETINRRKERWDITLLSYCTIAHPNVRHNRLYDVLENIYLAITSLPKPIKAVCFVQLFAFMGWCVAFLVVRFWALAYMTSTQVPLPLLLHHLRWSSHGLPARPRARH